MRTSPRGLYSTAQKCYLVLGSVWFFYLLISDEVERTWFQLGWFKGSLPILV